MTMTMTSSSHDNLMTIDPKDVVCGIASVVQNAGLSSATLGDEDVTCDKGVQQKLQTWILFDSRIFYVHTIDDVT